MNLCCWASISWHFEGSWCIHPQGHAVQVQHSNNYSWTVWPWNEGTMIFWNIRNYLPTDTVSDTRRLESSATLLWESHISQYLDYVLKRIVDIFQILPVYIVILCDLFVHLFEIQRSANISFIFSILCRTAVVKIYGMEWHRSLLLINPCINTLFLFLSTISCVHRNFRS